MTLGVLDMGGMTVETADVVVDRIRRALPYVAAYDMLIAPDCGMKHLPRDVAEAKMRAMVECAAQVRSEVGPTAS